MDITWTQKMFCASVTGSLAALFWPVAIKVWRLEMEKYQSSISANIPGAVRGAGRRKQSPLVARWVELLIKLIVMPFIRIGMKWLRFILLALFISSIASAVGFAAFLKNDEERKSLIALGDLAFFVAFNYGFMASSVVEEALKGK